MPRQHWVGDNTMIIIEFRNWLNHAVRRTGRALKCIVAVPVCRVIEARQALSGGWLAKTITDADGANLSAAFYTAVRLRQERDQATTALQEMSAAVKESVKQDKTKFTLDTSSRLAKAGTFHRTIKPLKRKQDVLACC